MRDRQYRRERREHHVERAKRFLKQTWMCTSPEEDIQLKALYFSRTRKPCSCWMCGNPRRYFKDVTLQEKVAPLAKEWE